MQLMPESYDMSTPDAGLCVCTCVGRHAEMEEHAVEKTQKNISCSMSRCMAVLSNAQSFPQGKRTWSPFSMPPPWAGYEELSLPPREPLNAFKIHCCNSLRSCYFTAVPLPALLWLRGYRSAAHICSAPARQAAPGDACKARTCFSAPQWPAQFGCCSTG